MSNPIIDEYGTQEWHNKDGKLHRTDGPAVIWDDGTQEWYANGEPHRTDGPAVIWADGTHWWYVNNTRIYSIKEYQKATGLSDEDMTMLVLKYGNIS